MYLCLANTGAICSSASRTWLRARSAFFWLPPSSASMWQNSSFSKRCRNSRARARITGSAGISCGCGKRSSMYSLMMLDSCSTRSRSTSTGTWLYGFITARSSGLWSRSTSMIWKSMPFSCSTMRQRWLNGSVVPEYSVIMAVLSSRGVAVAGGSGGRLVHFLPVLALQPVREHEQHAEEDQHHHAERPAGVLRGLRNIVEEVDQVAHRLAVLGGAH